MLLATCPTSRSLLITLMNKAVTAIRPPLMSPCICLYCLISRTGVSHITQLKLRAFRPSCRLIPSSLNSSLYPRHLSATPTHPSDALLHLFCSDSTFWLRRGAKSAKYERPVSVSTLPHLAEGHEGTLIEEQRERRQTQHSVR